MTVSHSTVPIEGKEGQGVFPHAGFASMAFFRLDNGVEW